MSLDPEFINELPSEEQDHPEEFREWYAMAPVFKHARDMQEKLGATQIGEPDIQRAWEATMDIIKKLDSEASEQGVIGVFAMLTGSGVEVPRLHADMITSASTIDVVDPPELKELTAEEPVPALETLERYYHAQEVRGLFSGFTLRFDKTDMVDPQGAAVYIPKLAYQIAFASVDIPHAHINLFATGTVDTAQIVFDHDVKKDMIAPLLERVYALCEKQEKSVSLIAQLLEEAPEYDGTVIRSIANHADKAINKISKENVTAFSDALIDFIGAYISNGDEVIIHTSAYSMADDTKDDVVKSLDGGELYEVLGENRGFVFMARIEEQDGRVVERNDLALNMVVTADSVDSTNVYVPLSGAKEFLRV